MSKISELLEAIGPKNNGNFIKLIEESENINDWSKSKLRTALHQACLYNNITAIEKLVSIPGIKLNSKDHIERTPLHLACLKNNHEAVAKLIETPGVEMNAKDKRGETPLHLACSSTSDEAVAILLKTPGVDANVKTDFDRRKQTPLHIACINNNHKAVSKLIETPGVDINVEDRVGKTPLFFACGNQIADETVAVLLKSPDIDVNVSSHFHGTPLHNAASNNNLQAISRLIEIPGIELNMGDHYGNSGNTPLQLACIEKHHQSVAKLINVPGVDVNASDSYRGNNTALHYACSSENYAVFSMLIDLPDIDVNVVNDSGRTPLHSVCRISTEYLNRCQVVKKLLANPEIDVNIKDDDGKTPILEAASKCDEEILKILLGCKRVETDAKDNDGKGLEELVMETCCDSKTECLEIIKKEMRTRQHGSNHLEKGSHKPRNVQIDQEIENIRANIRNQYIEKIEEINQKKKEVRLKLKMNADIKEAEIKKMSKNHDNERQMMKRNLDKVKMELDQKKTQLEQELAKNQQKIKEVEEKANIDSQEMDQRHREEKIDLEEMLEDKDGPKDLDNLTKLGDQLTKDLNKLDTDPDDLGRLEEAREIVECPICMEMMKPPIKIWMCPDSHIICEECKDQLDGNKCPTCRSQEVNLRAVTAEKLARALFHQ